MFRLLFHFQIFYLALVQVGHTVHKYHISSFNVIDDGSPSQNNCCCPKNVTKFAIIYKYVNIYLKLLINLFLFLEQNKIFNIF